MIVFRTKDVLLDGKTERLLFGVREENDDYVTEAGLKPDEEVGIIEVANKNPGAANGVIEQANPANAPAEQTNAVAENITLKLPDNITIIGNQDKDKIPAFEDGTLPDYYDNWFVTAEDIKKVTSIRIPSSVTTIKTGFFSKFTSLKEIIFEEPSNLENIYPRAFAECECLEKIVIPANADGKKVEIGVDAFVDCKKLESINLPDNSKITLFENDTFQGCDNLKSFNGADEVMIYTPIYESGWSNQSERDKRKGHILIHGLRS